MTDYLREGFGGSRSEIRGRSENGCLGVTAPWEERQTGGQPADSPIP
jgi:hypothetical protein